MGVYFLNLFDRLTVMDKELLRSIIEPGVTVVDATCGNGHDTLFLAEQVGDRGQVIAFDIQKQALAATKEKLRQAGFEQRVRLVEDSHENLEDHIQGTIRAAMFNLGYLPGSDKLITTEPDTSIQGIETALRFLEPGGILTCVVYPGHETGKKEAEAVREYCTIIDQQDYIARQVYPLNFKNDPPYMIAIKKRG